MMAKRKGMSLEEKRQTLLDVFHSSKDIFSLKARRKRASEVEKQGSARGVVLQSVKEVLQSLVDDDLVHGEKIGTSNFFWSFPSEAAVKLDAQLAAAATRLKAKQAEREALEKQVAASRAGKEDSEERQQLGAQLAALQAEVAAQAEELAEYAGNDPDRYDNLKEASKLACDSANRWIDNAEALRDWLKKKFEGRGSEIDNLFRENGIKEDAEYLKLP
ncbi:Meiotic nuclear division protein 1 [Chlorella vulgaris]